MGTHETAKGKEGGEISRRSMLRKIAGTGLVMTAGVGLLDVLGASSSSAQLSARRDARAGAETLPDGNNVTVPQRMVTPIGPDLTCGPGHCKATLSEGNCHGPCPSGAYCYHTNGGCGLAAGYYCFSSSGASSICYEV